MKKELRRFISNFAISPGLRVVIRDGKIADWRWCKKLLRMERIGQIQPKDDLAIIAMFRNEAPYLAEWIEYHKLMGVNRFYLFDNESTDNPIDVLLPYITDGTVVYQMLSDVEAEKLKGSYGQMSKSHIAHHLALAQCRMTAKWVAIIDIDEFILPQQHSNILEFLSSVRNANQVLLGWHCFGSGGHKKKPAGLTIESYLWRGDIPDHRAFKAIVNPRAIAIDLNHYHAVVGNTVDESGKIIRRKLHKYNAPANICPVNHYITRSKQECLDKCRKNKNIHLARYGSDFFTRYDCNDIYDDSMLKYARRLHKLIQHNSQS